MRPDLTYRQTCGLFVSFIPETEAGQAAWRQLAEHTDGTGNVLAVQAPEIIRRLRAAGYRVAKAKPLPPVTDDDLDALLAELNG